MKKFFYGILLLLIFFFSAYTLAQGEFSSSSQNYVSDEVIVKFKPAQINLKKNSGIISMQKFASNQTLTSEDIIASQNISVMKINDGQDVVSVIQDLQQDPNVEYVQPNFIYTLQATNPNDTYFNEQRWLKNIGQTIWWNVGISWDDIQRNEAMDIWSGDGNQNTTGTIVAVIDDGLRYTHPEFSGQLWDGSSCLSNTGNILGSCIFGYDFLDGKKNPLPFSSDTHGTHVAGIIWAKVNNGMGVAGINPWAKIMAIRAWSGGELTTSDIIVAIDFAKYNGAKIINASRWWWATWCDAVLDSLLYSTIKTFPGLFIAAAGNDNKQHLNNRYVLPADYNTDTTCRSWLNNIITVAASTNIDTKSTFSDYWSNINIAAPGTNIESTISTGSYAKRDGTSMATPFVVAVASLARSMRPELSYLDIKNAIINQAESISTLSGYVAGGKRLNAYTTLYNLTSTVTWSLVFLSWSITNISWTYVRLTASKTWTYQISWVGMTGILTWNISLTWLDVLVQLTSWDAIKNISVVFFDTILKSSQVYTASIFLDTTPPSIPILLSPISGTSISWEVNLLWNTSIDTWWMSGYVYEVSSDSGMTSLITSWTIYTTWVSIHIFSWASYYRRVKSFDILGQYSNFSQTWNFVLLRDNWPDSFSFPSVSNAELTTEYISNPITVSGINTGSIISIVWWSYQINNTWAFVSTTWIVYSWDTIKIKTISSSSNSTAVTATLDIGETYASYIVTTKSASSGWWGWGWGGGWGWWSITTTATCALSQLICSWWIYTIKLWVSCEWGSLGKMCSIVSWTVNTGVIQTGTNKIYKLFTNTNTTWWFSAELVQAYDYAYNIGVTTIPNIQQADLTGTLIRKHLAKMISNFAIKQMKKVPNTGMQCDFVDMDQETSEMKFYSNLACQLGLMGLDTNGIPTSTFNPNEEVNRAQFGTVLSRTLRGNQYNWGEPFYSLHLDELQKESIMKQINTPENKELRGYVMLMLMRSIE